MNILPDLGMYLIEKGYSQPFKLAAFSGMSLGKDSVLGWMISGTTNMSSTSSVDGQPYPIIPQPMMYSIYVGKGSKSRAEKLVQKLRDNGLVVVAREDKKYLVPSGKEWAPINLYKYRQSYY